MGLLCVGKQMEYVTSLKKRKFARTSARDYDVAGGAICYKNSQIGNLVPRVVRAVPLKNSL